MENEVDVIDEVPLCTRVYVVQGVKRGDGYADQLAKEVW